MAQQETSPMEIELTGAAAASPRLPALNQPRATALPTNPTKPSPMDTDEPDNAKTTRLPDIPQPVQVPAPIISSGQDHPEDDAWLLPALHKHGGEDFAAVVSDPSFDGPRRGRTAEELAVATTAAARVAAQREKAPLRKGKWTEEEELFTAAVIREFERGMLDCPAGTTLRSYLSEKLHCDPMRITKKFQRLEASIGKRVFTPCKQTPELQEEARRVRAELRDMTAWLTRPKPKATPKPVPAPTRRSARNAGVRAPPVDPNAGHTDKIGAARRNGTSLDWKSLTPDEPAKNLYEVLEAALVASEEDLLWLDNVREEASWLVERLKKSHPQSFPSLDGDYTEAFVTKVGLIRDELQGKPDAPYSSTTCPGMAQWVPELHKMALVKCAAVGSAKVVRYGCIPFLVLALVAVQGLCFLSLHVPSFKRAGRIVRPNAREGAFGLASTVAQCLGRSRDGEGRFLPAPPQTPRTAPLFLFRHVLLKELGLAGDDGTYHQQTFMARACGVGLRLPFYVMIYSLMVFMFLSRSLPAVYQQDADCFFGRMAAGLRPLWMATNALFEGEGTVGHKFLRLTYESGADLVSVVRRMKSGGLARIRIRPRLGHTLEYFWEGLSREALEQDFFRIYNAARREMDGIGTTLAAARLRLWSLEGKKKAEQDDEAIYGAPFDFSVRAYVDGAWQWIRGGRKLDGDEYELATVRVLNDANELRLQGEKFNVEDHAGPHYASWPGDQGLRARCLGLRKYADASYYLFYVFIVRAVIVAVWLHQDIDFERAVAKAENEADAARIVNVAAARATQQAHGRAAVGENRCAGARAGRNQFNRSVASVKALFAGIAAGMVQGCKDLAAAAARASSYDALVTRARNEHVRICAPTFARVRATHPLERAVQLGAVEFDAYLLIALRDSMDSFDEPTKARAWEEIRRIESSCRDDGEGGLSRLPRVGMPQPMSL